MEEREALKRQIELLQNLINKHKSVHGNTPFTEVEQRYPEASTSTRGRGHSRSIRRSSYAPGSWRKTYSLRNKSSQSSDIHPSASTSSVHQLGSQHLSHGISVSNHSREEESDHNQTATQQSQKGQMSRITGISEGALKKTSTYSQCKKCEGTAVTQHEGGKACSNPVGKRQHEQCDQTTESGLFDPTGKQICVFSEAHPSVNVKASTSLQSSSRLQIKPILNQKVRAESNQITTQTIHMTGKTGPHPGVTTVAKQPSLNPSPQKRTIQVGESFIKKSKFTWVKHQNIKAAEPRQGSSISSSTGKALAVLPVSLSTPGVTGSSHSCSISKKTPAKRLPRKINPVTVVPKTSKYRWVSSSALTQSKTPRKTISPKTLTPAQRALGKPEATVKLRLSSTPSKMKRGTSTSPGSRYRWKAGGQVTSVPMTGSSVARRRSAFHWTSEKSNMGVKGVLVTPSLLPQHASLPLSYPGGFKLRSRMKIIRRSASSACGTEKGSSPLRSRTHTWSRSPTGVRRAPSRLVSFGRHKLRRLSPSILSRTTPTSGHRSPASQRVFRTRYKMVTRPGCSAANALPYSPAFSWRVKKVQSARSFLQNRGRAPPDRPLSSMQPWRGSSMCWIRGSLYRVSANKLSRTVASNHWRSSSAQVSSLPPAWNRYSTSRHLASRAVQRSLAIIRHARQKKQQRQYCMYYNRFGKCNRGNSCPYIHDPDKVAVCTRFLRGTCKQADGTCPFSHKVAKEKMPVCSYFLKGICNNSDCPYSHVYVSRKAAVCQDFVKGYCPEGEKVCDFFLCV
ncbi:zinc finger CCCH domain-containing protein 3 isoform X2 [Betta splendens]|uniref:Zinc finger CCCH domain-containing protein 3 n=1 Tax=Betta splendens TaxID=158456 RepID=A0A6P7MAZ1_BETSP|nr:zinc finger CCCH domain-containing protein 3 isoform X2 [Betta splendens]